MTGLGMKLNKSALRTAVVRACRNLGAAERGEELLVGRPHR